MPSTSEIARAALKLALAPAMAGKGFDGFDRNVAALSDMRPVAGGGEVFATLRDGSIEVEAELLGVPRSYELVVRSDLELVVVEGDDALRDALFDALLIAASDAIDADPTLAAVVDDTRVERIDPLDLVVEGAAGVKAAIVVIRQLVTSARPF